MAKDIPQEFLKQFGKRLAGVRKEKNITQETLADATNLHRTYVGFIEQGKRNPSIGNVYLIAQALDVSISELIPTDLSATKE